MLHDIVDIVRIAVQNSLEDQKASESKSKEKANKKEKNKKPTMTQEQGKV